MDEWLWYLRFYLSAAAFLGSFCGFLLWLSHRVVKSLRKMHVETATEVFQDLSVALMEYFNAQLTERDKRLTLITQRLDGHEIQMAHFQQTLAWHGERLTDLAIAGTTVATIALYPTPVPSKREKDRAINEFQKLIIPRSDKIEPKGD
jgi:hypothetical protein